MPANDHDVRVEKWKTWSIIITVIAGPILAFIFAKSGADSNHAQSAKGYELLATMANQHEARLDAIEKALVRLETLMKVKVVEVPASQPVDKPPVRVPVTKAPATKAPTKAPVLTKAAAGSSKFIVMPTSAPAFKPAPPRAPLRAPAQLKDFQR